MGYFARIEGMPPLVVDERVGREQEGGHMVVGNAQRAACRIVRSVSVLSPRRRIDIVPAQKAAAVIPTV